MIGRWRSTPQLSVVVIAYNMQREIQRTLHTLGASYQQDCDSDQLEVILVDNGSSPPLDAEALQRNFAGRLRVLRREPDGVSPVHAVNQGVAMARGRWVAVMVDGARMLSPGLLGWMQRAFRLEPQAFVTTLGWHLGEEPQNTAMTKGYNQAVEDRLLASFDWQTNGYRLFDHACLALSCRQGWFSSIAESNCFALPKRVFQRLGGFDPRFVSRGGGLVNLDFFRLALAAPELRPVLLLGEGSFHQFHGGVATNVPLQDHPWQSFQAEYRAIRGMDYAEPHFEPLYLGRLSPQARRFLPGV